VALFYLFSSFRWFQLACFLFVLFLCHVLLSRRAMVWGTSQRIMLDWNDSGWLGWVIVFTPVGGLDRAAARQAARNQH
jgi:hypothetical protein